MKYKLNFKNKANGLDLLKSVNNESVKVVFFDPQYRGILDKMKYGNEGKKRGKARCELTQMSESTIKEFLKEIERVLTKSGYLFLWVDKFHLVEGVSSWFSKTKMNLVDMITWDKDKIGMGYRTRRRAEYLVVIQKAPNKAKRTWTNHAIPDVWVEKVKKDHPHSKPVNLQYELIKATTNKDDLVIDPASGGYSVFEACKKAKRNFLGCDIEFGE